MFGEDLGNEDESTDAAQIRMTEILAVGDAFKAIHSIAYSVRLEK